MLQNAHLHSHDQIQGISSVIIEAKKRASTIHCITAHYSSPSATSGSWLRRNVAISFAFS